MIGRWQSWVLNPDLVPEAVLLATVESHLHGELCKRTDSWILPQGGSGWAQESVWPACAWFKMADGGEHSYHMFLFPGPPRGWNAKYQVCFPLILGTLCPFCITFSLTFTILSSCFLENSFTEIKSMYHSVHPFSGLYIYLQNCAVVTTINLKTFLSPQQETLYPLSVTPYSSLPQPSAANN